MTVSPLLYRTNLLSSVLIMNGKALGRRDEDKGLRRYRFDYFTAFFLRWFMYVEYSQWALPTSKITVEV